MQLSGSKTIYDSNFNGPGIKVTKQYWIADNFPLGEEKEIEFMNEYFDDKGSLRVKGTKDETLVLSIVEALKQQFPSLVGNELIQNDWKRIKENSAKNKHN